MEALIDELSSVPIGTPDYPEKVEAIIGNYEYNTEDSVTLTAGKLFFTLNAKIAAERSNKLHISIEVQPMEAMEANNTAITKCGALEERHPEAITWQEERKEPVYGEMIRCNSARGIMSRAGALSTTSVSILNVGLARMRTRKKPDKKPKSKTREAVYEKVEAKQLVGWLNGMARVGDADVEASAYMICGSKPAQRNAG